MAALETNTGPPDDGRRRSGAVGRHPPAHRACTRGPTQIRASSCSTSRARILNSDALLEPDKGYYDTVTER